MHQLLFFEPSPLNSANFDAGLNVSRLFNHLVGGGTTTSDARVDVDARWVVGGIVCRCWPFELVVLVDFPMFLEVPHPLRLDPKFEFSLQVLVRLDFLSVSEMGEYPEVVVDSHRDPDVRCGSEVEMHVANIFDLQPWRSKTEILIDVGFVLQPISVNLDTVARILVDFRRETDRERFCRDSKLNKAVNLRLASKS